MSVLLMESSILSEVHNTSILRTGLSTDYAVISTSLAPQIVTGLRLRTRAAGWSGATSCVDPKPTFLVGLRYGRKARVSGPSRRKQADSGWHLR